MVDKVKKTPDEIKNEIMVQLKDGPKTISEIGEAMGSNWLTIEKFLNELKEQEKILEIISTPKMRVYRRADDLAFYGLPFSKEIRTNSQNLLFTIAEKWKSETETIPSKTILQKVAVELIEKSEGQLSKIPVLKFHYGQTLAVRYDETYKNEYHMLDMTSDQNALLLKIIREYKNLSSTKVQLKQYEKKGMEFYYEKEANLVKNLSNKKFKEIEHNLLKLSSYYPIRLQESYPLFEKFIYCSINLLNLNQEKEKLEALPKIKETFYLLWDTITTNYFFVDAERYIEPNQRELFNQIKLSVLNSKITNLSPIIEDIESEVNSINPEKICKETSQEAQEFIHELLED